jgi:uncharacterized protein
VKPMNLQISLLWAALLMGLTGGPHCAGMCGALCALTQQGQAQAAIWRFHGGRLLGYALLGSVAAGAVQGLGWSARQASWLAPLWGFWHATVIAWGTLMLATGKHPIWAQHASQALWQKIRSTPSLRARHFGILGVLWALMPCGLLYSALMLATLSNNAAWGGLLMASFALGSGLWLYATPALWRRLGPWREVWGQRLAGLMLVLTSSWAISMQWTQEGGLFCLPK